MGAAILRRLILALFTVAVGGFIAAMLARYAPGFETDERQLDPRLSRESVAALAAQHEQERNIFRYYVQYTGAMLHGQFGNSRSLNRPVRDLLLERSGVTVALVAKGMALAWLSALLLALLNFILCSRLFNIPVTLANGTLLCLPAAVVALLSVILGKPGYLAIALILLPKVYSYLYKSVEAARQMPHIVTARAKGLSESRVLLWHVVPVIRREIFALAGVSISMAISAAIPVEALCSIPGLGQLAWQSALARDLPVLIIIAMLVIACVTVANSGADLLAEDRRQEA